MSLIMNHESLISIPFFPCLPSATLPQMADNRWTIPKVDRSEEYNADVLQGESEFFCKEFLSC